MIEYFEIDVTEAAYEALKGIGPFLLTSLGDRNRGEAIGMLETLPDLDTVDYAEGYTNQTEEWIERYKNKYDSSRFANAKLFKQSEFETYRYLKTLPVMTYAFHLPKPESALITFGLIKCSTS